MGHPGGTDDGSLYDARPFVPANGDLQALRRAAADCRGCPLYAPATRTVFGEGCPSARVVLVGEQPGDQEDRQGRPFVGPAGRLLTRALDEAAIDPDLVYLTNAVKHFKFSRAERGKRRIHKAPSLREMTACKPWLAEELRVIDPEVVVALGATAGKALLGRSFKVTKDRGALLPLPRPDGEAEAGGGRAGTGGPGLVATIHPSAVLRAQDRGEREAAYAGLVSDLRVAAQALS